MDRDLLVLVLRCCIRGQREGERRFLRTIMGQSITHTKETALVETANAINSNSEVGECQQQQYSPDMQSLLAQQQLPAEGVVQAEGAAPLLLKGWAQIRCQWERVAGETFEQKMVRRNEEHVFVDNRSETLADISYGEV